MEGTWTLRPCPRRDVEALVNELGLSEVTASVLVRRGYGDPEAARAFLDAGPVSHDPLLLGDMGAACDAIRAAIAAGRRICVHGDYDVDGICATAVALTSLRRLGADADWHLPSRFEEGYGVARETLARLADEGFGLVLTVDCGITAVDEVAEARALGLDVVVTDHHRPGDRLPDCPVVAPRPSGYPFPELCGTGVVLQAGAGPARRRGRARAARPRRARDRCRRRSAARREPRPRRRGRPAPRRSGNAGLAALMRVAGVDPAGVDAGAIAFRLAPRINAAGRLGHPRAALELLLTDDPAVARRLADELEELNRSRQIVEERILREALAQVAAWPEAVRQRPGYVLWGEDWHPGVIGIVASRLVERFHRPVVLIAGGEDEWKGSGRSMPAFDLHGALAACAGDLVRFGGHRAAAGLTIEPARVEAFAQAFAAHASDVLAPADLRPVVVVDAVVRGDELTLELVEELERLAPFGLGNPGVTLLAPACELGELDAVGGGKHLRLAVRAGGVRSGAIAFGQGSLLDSLRGDGLHDVAFRLGANRWNGTVSPQLVVRRLFETPEAYEELRRRLAEEWRAGEAAWSAEARAVFDELGLAGETTVRCSLLESETFRALLEGESLPLREAA